jgi:hypothetical protein
MLLKEVVSIYVDHCRNDKIPDGHFSISDAISDILHGECIFDSFHENFFHAWGVPVEKLHAGEEFGLHSGDIISSICMELNTPNDSEYVDKTFLYVKELSSYKPRYTWLFWTVIRKLCLHHGIKMVRLDPSVGIIPVEGWTHVERKGYGKAIHVVGLLGPLSDNVPYDV